MDGKEVVCSPLKNEGARICLLLFKEISAKSWSWKVVTSQFVLSTLYIKFEVSVAGKTHALVSALWRFIVLFMVIKILEEHVACILKVEMLLWRWRQFAPPECWFSPIRYCMLVCEMNTVLSFFNVN